MIKKIILHTIITEKRNIFFSTMVMAAIFLFFSTICAGTYTDFSNTLRISYSAAITIANIALFICMILSASKMMSPLKTRASSIKFLMLPASNRDKFIARWIIGVVGYSLMFLCALIMADVVQAIYNICLRFTTGSLTLSYFSDVFNSSISDYDYSNPSYIVLTHSIVSFLWFHAVYTLGSTFFRSMSFIKTTLLLIGVLILLSIIFTSLMVPLVYSNKTYTVHLLVDPELMGNITFYLIAFGTIIGAYYWAYRRFCNKMIA